MLAGTRCELQPTTSAPVRQCKGRSGRLTERIRRTAPPAVACLETKASLVHQAHGISHAHLARSSSSCSTTDSAVPVKASGRFQGGLVGRPGGAGDCVRAAAGGALQRQAAPWAWMSNMYAGGAPRCAGNRICASAGGALQQQAAPGALASVLHAVNAGNGIKLPALAALQPQAAP